MTDRETDFVQLSISKKDIKDIKDIKLENKSDFTDTI